MQEEKLQQYTTGGQTNYNEGKGIYKCCKCIAISL